jgi:hypothetical protein
LRYLYYLCHCSPINGSVTKIIPCIFSICDSPDPSIHGSLSYHEVDGTRRFSPDFYADLLHHLGVSMVLRLGGADYDPAPFISRGIRVCGVEDLGCSAASLAEDADIGIFDRFAALAHAAGGPVALHGGPGGGKGLGLAATLIAGWMAGLHFFPSAEAAVAWVQIARGCAVPVVWGPLRRYWAQRRPRLGPQAAQGPPPQAHTTLLPAPQPRGLPQEPDSQIRRRDHHHHHHHHHHGHRDHVSGKHHHHDHSGHHAAADQGHRHPSGHAMSSLHGRSALSADALTFDRSESEGEGGKPRLHQDLSVGAFSRSSPALLHHSAPVSAADAPPSLKFQPLSQTAAAATAATAATAAAVLKTVAAAQSLQGPGGAGAGSLALSRCSRMAAPAALRGPRRLLAAVFLLLLFLPLIGSPCCGPRGAALRVRSPGGPQTAA